MKGKAKLGGENLLAHLPKLARPPHAHADMLVD
jgi:hypothetical protein